MTIVTGADVAKALSLPGTTPTLDEVAQVADEWLVLFLAPSVFQPIDGVDPVVPAPVREAGITIAIDVLQNRTAAGGQSVGVDGTPGPYRMGSSLMSRVQGLVGPWLAQGSEIG